MNHVAKFSDCTQLDPVTLLVGDSYLCDQAVQTIKQAICTDAMASESYHTVDAREFVLSAVLQQLKTVPMFGGIPLVIVRNCEDLKAESGLGLATYAKQPNKDARLVLVATKVDARQKWVASIKKLSALVKFDPIKEREAPGWVATEARSQGITLNAGVAQFVADAIGTDLAQLSAALERLKLYTDGNPVSLDDAATLLMMTRQRSIFELTDSVGRLDRTGAITVLRNLLGARESGVRIVTMLSRHLRQLWMLRSLAAKRLSAADLAKQVGVHPYFLNAFKGQAASLSNASIYRMHRALTEADMRLKSTSSTDEVVLSQLILSLCPVGSAQQG